MSGIFIFLAKLINLYIILLFIRILMSWIAPRANWYNQPLKFLYDITEPLMEPFRRIIPPLGGIDFSPIVLFILLSFLQNILINLATQTANF